MTLQDTLAITYRDSSTKDKLKVVFGAMLKNLASKADYVSLINKNYSDNPIKGGSVHIDRLAFATVRNYLTAHGNQAGDTPKNNGIDILVNQDKEIITEVPKKDARAWREGGEAELLANVKDTMVDALRIYLDDVYFVALQQNAQTVDVSAGATTVAKLLILIRALEDTTTDNINKVDRENMVLTLASEWYDEVETYMTNLPNPDGNSKKALHGVEVKRALRQDVDAVVQIRGAMGMPMVIDNYVVGKPSYKNALVQELYISYGLGVVEESGIKKAALDESISI